MRLALRLPKRKPLSSTELAQRKIILPHFNDLGIIREAVYEVGRSTGGLTDDGLVEVLNKRRVIPGEDPRRGRNIFEACLYLGLVTRRVNTELRYNLNKTGKSLLSLRNNRKELNEEEIRFFTDRAIRFKVPNNVHYQDTLLIREKVRTGFKHYYLTKRIRPFASFLTIASKVGKKISRERFISSATTALLAENEASDSFDVAESEVKKIAKEHGFDESRSPFRDAQVLTSWSEQLGIYERTEDTFRVTPYGKTVIGKISRQVPVWWLDFVESHHASMLLSLMELSDSNKVASTGVLSEALESVTGKKINLQQDLGEVERFGVTVKGDEVSLAKEPLFEIEYDVPAQAHPLIQAQSNAITKFVSGRVSVPVVVPTPSVIRVPEGPPLLLGKQLSDLPALAWRTSEAIKKYGEPNVAGTFEDLVFKAFQHFGFEITQLGHVRIGRAVPDLAIVDTSTLAQRQAAYAVLVDCKSTGSPYGLTKSDERAISDYIRDSVPKLLLERTLLRFFLVMGPQFTNEFTGKLTEIDSARTYGVSVVGMEADALVRLVELHDTAPYVLSKNYLRLDQILDSAVRQKTGVVDKTLVETLFLDAKRKK